MLRSTSSRREDRCDDVIRWSKYHVMDGERLKGYRSLIPYQIGSISDLILHTMNALSMDDIVGELKGPTDAKLYFERCKRLYFEDSCVDVNLYRQELISLTLAGFLIIDTVVGLYQDDSKIKIKVTNKYLQDYYVDNQIFKTKATVCGAIHKSKIDNILKLSQDKYVIVISHKTYHEKYGLRNNEQSCYTVAPDSKCYHSKAWIHFEKQWDTINHLFTNLSLDLINTLISDYCVVTIITREHGTSKLLKDLIHIL